MTEEKDNVKIEKDLDIKTVMNTGKPYLIYELSSDYGSIHDISFC